MSASAGAAGSERPAVAPALIATSNQSYVRYDDLTPCEGQCAHREMERRRLASAAAERRRLGRGDNCGSTAQTADESQAAAAVSTPLYTIHSLSAALDETPLAAESPTVSDVSKPDPWTHQTWQDQQRQNKSTATCICWRLHKGQVQFLLVRLVRSRAFSVLFHRMQECQCVLPAHFSSTKERVPARLLAQEERVEKSLLAQLRTNLPNVHNDELDLLVRASESDAGFEAMWADTASVPAVYRKSCCNMRKECARRNYALPSVRAMLRQERDRVDRPEPPQCWSIPKGSTEQQPPDDPHEQQRLVMLTACRELREEAQTNEDPLDTTDYVQPACVDVLSDFHRFVPHQKRTCLVTLREDCPRLRQDEWEVDPARSNLETSQARWCTLTEAYRLNLSSNNDWMRILLHKANAFCSGLAGPTHSGPGSGSASASHRRGGHRGGRGRGGLGQSANMYADRHSSQSWRSGCGSASGEPVHGSSEADSGAASAAAASSSGSYYRSRGRDQSQPRVHNRAQQESSAHNQVM